MEATPAGHHSDPLLAAFLAAGSPAESERLLGQLLKEQAAPVIARVLHHKIGRSNATGNNDVADLTSAAREELITRLLAVRGGENPREIRNFRGYVAAVAYNVWAQHLRTANPGRAMLLNRVRYLLENRTTQRGFAMWDGRAGERLCGLESARTNPQPVATTPKLQLLAIDPFAVAREAFAGRDWRRLNLAELLAGLFRWLETGVELRHLLDALVELLEVSDEIVSIEADSAITRGDAFVDAATPAIDVLKWTEYLRWLWAEIGRLPMRQRSAFLLHSDVVRELDLHGIATLREIAAALEFAPEEFARIWSELPQDDVTIGHRLQLQRQQVINLRRAAREHLGAAWRAWIK